jgi:hypothetical protein
VDYVLYQAFDKGVFGITIYDGLSIKKIAYQSKIMYIPFKIGQGYVDIKFNSNDTYISVNKLI